MGYTIAVIGRKCVRKIQACKDVNAVIPIDECTYDNTVLEKPLDKIYAVLNEIFPPLNGPDAPSDGLVDKCVEYAFLPNAIYIGYTGGQYEELNKILDSLLRKYDCAIYNCDWDTISWPENSVRYRLVEFKYWLKTSRWVKALRDTLLLFMLSELSFLVIWYMSVRMEGRVINLSSVPFLALTIGAAVLASSRFLAEVILHFKSKK